MPTITKLKLSWSTSRGQDTYGYNICRLDDTTTGRRYKCIGGGYDMVGTVFGEWLEENYQEQLLSLNPEVNNMCGYRKLHFVGQRVKVSLDGGCGIESMIRIAKAIGLEVETMYNSRKRENEGFYVSEYTGY